MLTANGAMLDFLHELYQRVDAQISAFGPTCGNCRRCCDFSGGGLNLFVTNLELAYFVARIKTVPKATGGRCPFLDDRTGCTARGARPLGCRTYFCKVPEGYDPQAIYEDALNRIKTFLRENHLPYLYQEWLKSLAQVDNLSFD
jgi:Fe-S-cluster containining protein